MKATYCTKPNTYSVSGQDLRICFDIKQGEDSEGGEVWTCQEALVNIWASRSQIIEAIMACTYPTPGAEFAAICNGGDDLAAHEAARVQAKKLAADWIGRG
jgi:hypothetical protein